jgi:hypothetical protein
MKQELPANQQDPNSKIGCNPSTVCVRFWTSIPISGVGYRVPGVYASESGLGKYKASFKPGSHEGSSR